MNEFDERKKDLIQEHENLIKGLKEIEEICDDTDNIKSLKDKYSHSLKHNLERLKQEKFSMAFIGERSSGKSTLINALINKEEQLPSKTGATTAVITKIRHGERDFLEIYFKNKKELKKEMKRIKNSLEEIEMFKYVLENKEMLNEFLESEEFDKILEMIDLGDSQNRGIAKELTNKLEYLSEFLKEDEIDKKEDTLESIENYVVENFDGKTFNKETLRVREVIMNLSTLDIPNNIELVDLPGLGTMYKHHTELSLKYAKEAHTFAFLTKAAFDSGDFINDFLPVVKGVNLEKAFWIYTACESKSKEVLEKDISEVKNSLYSNGININKIYPTSAIKYFNNEEPKYKLDIDNLREDILDYLNNNARKDFYDELSYNLKKLKDEIKKIEDVQDYYAKSNQLKNEGFEEKFKKEEAEKRVDELINGYSKIVTSTFNAVADKLEDVDVWNEKNKKNIMETLSDTLNNPKVQEGIKKYSIEYRRMNHEGEFHKSQGSGIYRNRIIEHIDNNVRFNNLIQKNIKVIIEEEVEGELAKILHEKLLSLDSLKDTSYENQIKNILNNLEISKSINNSIDNSLDDYDNYIEFINDNLYKVILNHNLNEKDSSELNKIVKEKLDYSCSLKKGSKDAEILGDAVIFYKASMNNYLLQLNETINEDVSRGAYNSLFDVKNKLEKILDKNQQISIYEEIKENLDIKETLGNYVEKFEKMEIIINSIYGERL